MKALPVATFTALLLVSCLSQASVYITCGTGEASEDMSYGANQELAISSGDDQFQGPVGGTWELKLKTAEDWMAATPKVQAVSSEIDGETAVEVTLTRAMTPSGRVGTRYILKNIYSDTPSLQKFTMGGFAGSVQIGQFTCVSAID